MPSMAKHSVRPIMVSALVTAPPEEVFSFVSDTRNDPLWCPNVERVELVGGEGIAVGTRLRFHQHLDPPGRERIHFDVDLEVIGLGENTITWLASDKFQTREITLTVEPEGAGSKVTQVTPGWWLR